MAYPIPNKEEIDRLVEQRSQLRERLLDAANARGNTAKEILIKHVTELCAQRQTLARLLLHAAAAGEYDKELARSHRSTINLIRFHLRDLGLVSIEEEEDGGELI